MIEYRDIMHKAIDEKKLIDADKLIEDLIPILQCLDNAFIGGRIIMVIARQPKLDVPDINVGKWIPCSERLPEKSGWYLVTVSDGEIEFDQFFAGEPNHSWRGFCHNTVKTIAWMSLPEPYKGDE